MVARKKGGKGGKLSRSEVVTVRLDPRLRYGVELAARKHRRTASSFIEWAIERALQKMVIREGVGEYQGSVTAEDVLNKVWDVDEPDRFAKLAINFPELLTHEEQILWKLIRECGALWRGHWEQHGDRELWAWEISERYLDLEQLREHWDTFIQTAKGYLTSEGLPHWDRDRPADDLDAPPF